MARALADDPRLLVLITPTAGVDVRSKEILLGEVEEAAAAGTGVLIVSDELDDLRICDRVLVMFQGRVVAEMRPRLERPRTGGRHGRSGPRCLTPTADARRRRRRAPAAAALPAAGCRSPGCATWRWSRRSS